MPLKSARRSRAVFHVAALTAGLFIAVTPPQSQGLVLVEDVPHMAQDAASEIVNLGKYITMIARAEAQIANQIEQINHQVETLKRFGDPNYYINMLGLNKLITELQNIQARANLTVYEFNRIIQAGEALRYTGQGLYQDITQLPDRFGKVVKYDADSFKKFAMVQRMYDDYDRQQQNYRTSIQTLTTELNNTITKLNGASTQMETEKYTAKIHAISAAMTSASDQLKQAGQRLEMQDISNRNDAARTAEADRQREIQSNAAEGSNFGRNVSGMFQATPQ
jgi:hypothetical protein